MKRLSIGICLLVIGILFTAFKNNSNISAVVASTMVEQTPSPLVDSVESLPCIDRTFQVAVHFSNKPDGFVTSDTLLMDAFVAAVNGYFAPICIQFEVCELRVMDNFHFSHLELLPKGAPNEVTEMVNTNFVKNRINLYIVDYFTENGAYEGTPGGFASLAGIQQVNNSHIVVKSDGGVSLNTLVHEMGHYFGLEHTFETSNGEELVDGSNCETAGDGICDTPADPYEITEDHYDKDNCTYMDPIKDANGDYYAPNLSNIMSYYSGCQSEFTRGQYKKMAETYLAGPKDQW